jgi:hypothetical protein
MKKVTLKNAKNMYVIQGYIGHGFGFVVMYKAWIIYRLELKIKPFIIRANIYLV